MKKVDIKDKRRLLYGITAVLLPIILVIMLFSADLNDWSKFIWILSFAFMGLGVAGIWASSNTDHDDKNFYIKYFRIYPVVIFTSSSLIFFLANSAGISSDSLYLSVTATNAFLVGRFVDYLSPWLK